MTLNAAAFGISRVCRIQTFISIPFLLLLLSNSVRAFNSAVRLQHSDELIQIGDREPYNAKLTSLAFHKPICVLALEIQTLQPLTGVEDVELTYSLCDDPFNQSWTRAHYMNKKNVFVLRHPVMARKLAVIVGYGRSTSSDALTVLNVDIKQCHGRTIFGEDFEESLRSLVGECPTPSKPTEHRHHRHRHDVKTSVKIAETEMDHLLLGREGERPEEAANSDESVKAVFVRSKRQAEEQDSFFGNAGFPTPPVFLAESEACPSGYGGFECGTPNCDALRNCSNSGTCVLPNVCKCAPNYFGPDCSQCSGWFCNQCDFYCVHGQCDAVTKACRCRAGWSGAACDVCADKNCPVEPEVRLVLPQALERSSQGRFMFVHGRDLPKPEDTRYNCVFGGVVTAGNWLSSQLLRCAVPERSQAGKFVFNVAPSGSEVAVPNEEQRAVHVTFYTPCSTESCKGDCLGPVCLCKHNQSGDSCADEEQQPKTQSKTLTDAEFTNAEEGVPYEVRLPVDGSMIVAQLETEIDDIEVDPFRQRLLWKEPRGREKPYVIKVLLTDENAATELAWELVVHPSYTPLTGKVKPSGINNSFLLRGILEREANHTSKTNPVLVELLSSKKPDQVIEQLQIPSYSPHAFSHSIFPYAGEHKLERFTVRTKHPGHPNDTSNCATFTVKKFIASPITPYLHFSALVSTAEFATNALDLDCTFVNLSVLTPRDAIAVKSWRIEANRLKADLRQTAPHLGPEATLLFHCGPFLGHALTLPVTDDSGAKNAIRVDPAELNFYTGGAPMLVRVQMHFDRVPTAFSEPLVSATNVLPFFIAASSPSNLQRTSIYKSGKTVTLTLGLLKAPTEEGIVTGVLQLPNAENPIIHIPYHIHPSIIGDSKLTVLARGFAHSNSTKPIDYPIELSIESVNAVVTQRHMIYLNVPSQFGPFPSGSYKISLQSPAFESQQSTFHLSPQNANFTIFLLKKRELRTVFDGQDFLIDTFPVASDRSIQAGAEVALSPSTFPSQLVDREFYVDVVFARGPNNATAFVNFSAQNPKLEFWLEPVIASNETLCVGCGLRYKVKLRHRHNGTTDCPTFFGTIPFRYVVPEVAENFAAEINYIVEKQTSKNDLFSLCAANSSFPEVTVLKQECATAKMTECRRLYQPTQGCGSVWRKIPDDTLSIHVYGLFLQLRQRCHFTGIDISQLQTLMQCVSSLDADCPIARDTAVTLAQTVPSTTPSAFSAMFSQLTAISPITQSLHGFFPALSTIEAQLIDFPNHMAQFLHYFEQVFPTSEFAAIQSPAWFDFMHGVVADKSAEGPSVTEEELTGLPDWKAGQKLLLRWNETNQQLAGEDPELLSPTNANNHIAVFRKLVATADKLKSLARQFGAKDPFAMLHDTMSTMFAKLEDTDEMEAEVGRALGIAAPAVLREEEEFQVDVVLTNTMANQVLHKLKFQLEFLNEEATKEPVNLSYRIGPLFYSGSINDYLAPGTTITASWKVQPVPLRRLTRELVQRPNVIFTYSVNGKRKVHRVRVNPIEFIPNRHLRIFAVAHPLIAARPPAHEAFSLNLYLMNSGYTSIERVHIADLSLWLERAGKPVAFRFNAVGINGIELSEASPEVVVTALDSGDTTVVSFNLTTLGSQTASFRNCSLRVTVDEEELPEFFQFKFFRVKEILPSQAMIITDGDPDSFDSALSFFDPRRVKNNDLNRLQLLETTESDVHTSTSAFRRVHLSFQRLLDPEQLAAAASPEGLSQTESSVYGFFEYPKGLEKEQRLVRVSQIGPDGAVRRLVPLENVWETTQGKQRQLNFVDQKALPAALAQQLSYDFIFGRNGDFNAPYFSQKAYRIRIPEDMVVRTNTVVGDVTAKSPMNAKVNYTLVSDNQVQNFAINPKTGEVVLLSDELPYLDPDAQETLCYNVISTDQEGRQAVVPLVVVLPDSGSTGQNCKVFSPGTKAFSHTFGGSREDLQMMTFHQATKTPRSRTTLPPSVTVTSGKTSTKGTTRTNPLTTSGVPLITTTEKVKVEVPMLHGNDEEDEEDESGYLTVAPLKGQHHATPPSRVGPSYFNPDDPDPDDEMILTFGSLKKPNSDYEEDGGFIVTLASTAPPSEAPPTLNTVKQEVTTSKTTTTTPTPTTTTATTTTTTSTTTISESTTTTASATSTTSFPFRSTPRTTHSNLPDEDETTEQSKMTTLARPRPSTLHVIRPDDYLSSISTKSPPVTKVGSNENTVYVIQPDDHLSVPNTTTPSVELAKFTEQYSTPGVMAVAEASTRSPNLGQESSGGHDKAPPVETLFPSTKAPPSSQQPNSADGDSEDEQAVNFMTSKNPPPSTTPLPIQTGGPIGSTINRSRQKGSSSETDMQGAAMIDNACRLRDTKAIFAVLCDMAKTVHFKPM